MVETLRDDLSRLENQKTEQRVNFENETNVWKLNESALRQELSNLTEQLNSKLSEISNFENRLNEAYSSRQAVEDERNHLSSQLEQLNSRLNDALSAHDLARELNEKCQSK